MQPAGTHPPSALGSDTKQLGKISVALLGGQFGRGLQSYRDPDVKLRFKAFLFIASSYEMLHGSTLNI